VPGQAALGQIGFDNGEDVGEGLGVGNAVGHFDLLSQPVDLKVAEVFDVGKEVHPTKHGTNGHKEHFTEMVQLVAAGTWVFEDGE
jgi:hypothetical protein